MDSQAAHLVIQSLPVREWGLKYNDVIKSVITIEFTCLPFLRMSLFVSGILVFNFLYFVYWSFHGSQINVYCLKCISVKIWEKHGQTNMTIGYNFKYKKVKFNILDFKILFSFHLSFLLRYFGWGTVIHLVRHNGKGVFVNT